MKMLGIYFSGTGNTKYCIEKLMSYLNDDKPISIERPEVVERIRASENIILAYPTQFSNIPKIMKDFINNNRNEFKGKSIFIMATMGLFSGDGAGCGARLLKKHGAHIIGGLHVKMPDNVADVKLLKKSLERNQKIVQEAEIKLKQASTKLKQGKPPKNGLSMISHVMGLVCQRMWCYNKTKSYSDELKINHDSCIKCGKCTTVCPMKNLTMHDQKVVTNNKCAMCYRCIAGCPKKSITCLGTQVVEQVYIEKYII